MMGGKKLKMARAVRDSLCGRSNSRDRKGSVKGYIITPLRAFLISNRFRRIIFRKDILYIMNGPRPPHPESGGIHIW